MSLIYYLNVSSSDGALAYTSSVSDRSKCSIVQNTTDYKLITKFSDTTTNISNLKEAVSRMEITVKLPDGTVVVYPDTEVSYTIRFKGVTEDRYYIHVSIANKSELTSQVGDVLGLVKMYDSSNQIIASAAFVVSITAMTGLVKNRQQIRLDFWPGAIPTRIHVSQYDQNVQLIIYGYNSKGSVGITSTTTGGIRILTTLEGKRPDRQDISVTVNNFTNVTNKPFYNVYTEFILPPEFTDISGEYLLQFRIQHRDAYTNSKQIEMRSSKIILIVEPAP